jgi:anti-sigma regulatory factor (Ser/Thr protein kinase)
MTRQALIPCASSALARTFAGTAAQAAAARRWARAVVAGLAGPDAAGLAEAAVAELLANAVTHSRSGLPGGMVTVIIAGSVGGVTVHVHDLGAAAGAAPRPRRPGDLAESGRGLWLVQELSAAWGTCPAAGCGSADVGGLAGDGRGCCVWFGLEVPQGTAGRRAVR